MTKRGRPIEPKEFAARLREWRRRHRLTQAQAVSFLSTASRTIPDYAYDCHTLKGRGKGKTKADFFHEEQWALKPFQPGLFDDLVGGE